MPGTRLAGPVHLTRVMIEAVLLARLGSLVVDETVTELVIDVFFAITVTTISVVLWAVLASDPIEQLSVPDAPLTGATHVP